MTFTAEQERQLGAPLDRRHVATRSQAGRSLSYIEGWHAISEANRIFGFGGWSSETIDVKCVSERERKIGQQQRAGFGVSYIARVRITVFAGERTIIREGIGSGHGIDTDLGLAHESAIKEAETDARKRGLMTFGNPFGLALYDKTQANVADVGGMASERDAIDQLTDPKPKKEAPAQERPSSPPAPSAKQDDWRDRERKILEDRKAAKAAKDAELKASAAKETDKMAGEAVKFLDDLRDRLKKGGKANDPNVIQIEFSAWKQTYKVTRKRFDPAQQARIDKAGFALKDALAAIARQDRIDPDTGEIIEDAA